MKNRKIPIALHCLIILYFLFLLCSSINREGCQAKCTAHPSNLSGSLTQARTYLVLCIQPIFLDQVKMRTSCMVVCTLLVLLLAKEHAKVDAVTCSPAQLSSCVSAITSSTPPTNLCCSKIKEQKPCLCQYLKNPKLQKFINTPNARKVASTCGTPFPKC